MTLHNLQSTRPGKLWQTLAMVFCVAFGLAHLLNVFTAGDGLWYWYAVLFDRGQLLYADLHLNLQPFFIVATRLALHVFGHSWLGFRVFPLLQVVLYTVGLALVAGYAKWSDGRRALLILAAFGVTLTIFYYRFDDFHVTTQILQVYSLWLLLRLHRHPRGRRVVGYAAMLGVLAGISVANRLNDGVALFAAAALALAGIAVQRRWAALAVLHLAAAAAFASVVLSTGDTFAAWYRYTVVEAAKIKGGSGHILLYPAMLPVRILEEFGREPHRLLLAFYPVLMAACGAAMLWIVRRFKGGRRVALLAGVAALLLLALPHYWKTVRQGLSNPTLAELGVPLAYALFILLGLRVFRAARTPEQPWNSLSLLLLVPLFQMFLAAMTGGTGIVETTPAMALTLLLMPVLFPSRLRGVVQDGLVILLGLTSFSAYFDKAVLPFHWHHFYSDTMFQNRQWYHHPVYGPMYVDTRQLRFILPVCAAVSAEPGTGLLALPYPHANYFCNVPPWHGYVQTWYDTSSRDTINQLVRELSTSPPTWVFYERSLLTMSAHELVYTNGQPLPHRALDALIVSRLQTRQWTAVQQKCFGGADWMLIRTTPPQAADHPTLPVQMGNQLSMCDYTQFSLD